MFSAVASMSLPGLQSFSSQENLGRNGPKKKRHEPRLACLKASQRKLPPLHFALLAALSVAVGPSAMLPCDAHRLHRREKQELLVFPVLAAGCAALDRALKPHRKH